MGNLSHGEYIDSFTADAAAIRDVFVKAVPELSVPATPEWDLGRLVKHIGTVFVWGTAVVEQRPERVDPRSLDIGLPEERSDYGEWLVRAASKAAAVMSAADPSDDCWSWGADSHAVFWSRRLANEIGVHRWDVQSAFGDPDPIAPQLAADGLDEILENLTFRPDTDLRGVGERLHLHATDCDGEWLITLGAEGVEFKHEHAKGDVAARATASDLLLLILGRVAPSSIETFGDVEQLDRWQQRLKF
ncbi:unannotated protein [freshwater metagenome]|uniref:Unannotated protein n=1 Tax=freshwater metagenome TaxID=449393 RepID=A0A6J7CU52_9ZZZZ